MPIADAAGDYLRLAEHYRQMKDPELLSLLRQSGALTDLARQVLEAEVYHRRLQPEPEEPPPTPASLAPLSPDPSDHSDPYEDDRKLVDLCTVWSLRDALQLQTLLDRASIPFFIGPEKATGVAEVTSNFANGLIVQVMRVGLPWTYLPMSNYFPKDEPPEAPAPEPEGLSLRCPRCQSDEVVFNALVREPAPNNPEEFPPSEANSDSQLPESDPADPASGPPRKFDWTCQSCGYHWQDDGVAKEA